jgi:ribonuclease inhibitor
MMKTIVFNFDKIHSLQSFYSACKQQLQLTDHFGNNLDALWDCITAGIELPVTISFINLSPYHLVKFERQIDLFRDAEKELDGELTFEYHTRDERDAG